jgi:hypothetical protein
MHKSFFENLFDFLKKQRSLPCSFLEVNGYFRLETEAAVGFNLKKLYAKIIIPTRSGWNEKF